MFKLKFFLDVYARPFYWRLAAVSAVLTGLAGAASFTAWSGVVGLLFGIYVAAIMVTVATLAILVLNVVIASSMNRCIERFEAAYDAYRRANKIPDLFYEEMDLAEAAAAREAEGATVAKA